MTLKDPFQNGKPCKVGQDIIYIIIYSVFINYCVFSLRFCDFFNNARSAAALVFYLPGVCTHTNTEVKQSPAYF